MTDSSGQPQDGQGGYDPADPWAPPERVELGKSAGQPPTPTPPPVHDQPTMAAVPPADVPPPPVAPTGPGYGYPTAPAPPAGQYGYPGYPGYGGYGQGGWPQAPSNGMGTAAMVLGILALTIGWCYGVPALVLGVLALIFGILGRKRVQRGEANNGGQALAGIIMGSIGIVIGVIFIALFAYIIANADKFDEDSDYDDDPFQTTLVVPGRS
ncbi:MULTISPECIES: DUF4190 domain-containing protein [Streptomyces]|uniref:DUF4190 domain-containing protein n=1 Tax=Streptomyces solicathayae TaxID=3081768 RepID=A0ABZ0LQN7_9ACTN|nr:DUF4190 domain-containing protein [Streptomyces sp. HUAS YS2]WOX21799.1 DUF4190 domain-containing protein [Streptomyces sp. HUAS YS2]